MVNDDTTYSLMIGDYDTDQTDTILDYVAKGETNACNGEYDIENRDSWEGHKAILVSLDCPATQQRAEIDLMVHVVVDGNRIYRVMCAVTEAQSKASPHRADRGIWFLKSLHLK